MASPNDPAAGAARSGTSRARVIIMQDGAVALIERQRGGVRYYVFPGGGVEGGETPEAAAAREAEEELGLRVAVGALVAEVIGDDRRQCFFLATPTGGTFGAGCEAEMVGGSPATRGTYRAVCLPLAALAGVTIYPRAVAVLAAASAVRGWPAPPPVFCEPAV